MQLLLIFPLKKPLCDYISDTSLARNRSRRTKTDKTGRLAALEKLKKAKQSGEKFKYEVRNKQISNRNRCCRCMLGCHISGETFFFKLREMSENFVICQVIWEIKKMSKKCNFNVQG